MCRQAQTTADSPHLRCKSRGKSADSVWNLLLVPSQPVKNMKKPIPTILHVEDLESDRILVTAAFQRSGFLVDIQSAKNEEEALEYLQSTGIYAARKGQPLPNLVLLDLKLDHKSGAGVLVWIRKQPEMKKLPVVILSSSDQPEDRQQAKESGANEYFCKPVSIGPFLKVVEEIYTRWLG